MSIQSRDAKNIRSGACLCGAVSVFTAVENTDVGACSCGNCLQWSGSSFMELECGANVEFSGRENIQTYESSSWAVRGFCKICGSHLFIQEKDTENYGVAPGLFEDADGLSLNRQVFYDNQPDYYSFSNSTTNISSDYIHEHFPKTREDIK